LRALPVDLRRQEPLRPVQLWCEDEARLGLKPLAHRVWALCGQRPHSSGRQSYQSLYVHGFAQPVTVLAAQQAGRYGTKCWKGHFRKCSY
jgi:hypothetical protein